MLLTGQVEGGDITANGGKVSPLLSSEFGMIPLTIISSQDGKRAFLEGIGSLEL